MTFDVEGIQEVEVTLLRNGATVSSTGPLAINPGDNVVTVDLNNAIGDKLVITVVEDIDPATDLRVGNLLADACYHPIVVSTTTIGPSPTSVIVTLSSGASSSISTISVVTTPSGWSTWSPWGECTVTCGVGEQARFRECDVTAGYIGDNPCDGSFLETQECIKEDCPTTPGWTEWTPWSLCDVLCGEGVQLRYRECTNPEPLPGQTGCLGPAEEEITCTESPCECTFDTSAFVEEFGYQPGEVIGWMEKDGIDGPTDPSEEVKLGDRVGNEATIFVDCNECTCVEGSFACNASSCVNCTYSTWTEWTPCTKTCDVGQRARTRNLVSTENLQTCTEPRDEVEDCNTDLCPVTEEWSTWSEWSNCTATDPCDVGSRTRTRDCPTSESGCAGDPVETEPCGEPCDEPEANCTTGKVWADCAFVCPQTCEDFRLEGYCTPLEACEPGCKCPDGYVESQDGTCIVQDTCPCYTPDGVPVWPGFPYNPVDTPCESCECGANGTLVCTEDPECCDWDEWTSWGECSVECGEGTRNRYRQQLSGVNCGSDVESEDCILGSCPAGCVVDGVDYEYGDLISDDFCEKCYCTIENPYYCTNDTLAVEDGDWAEWSDWSSCSSTCTGGSRSRSRTCSDPLPRCGGLECPGNNTETEDCNAGLACCTLTSYGPWSDCSEECGDGYQTRNRTYDNADDALVCNNTLEETQLCNYGDCNMTCVLSDWSEWSPCSASCGLGVSARDRNVIVDAPDCPDLMEDFQDCSAGDCPCPDNQVWSNYSLCQRTCDERIGFNNTVCGIPSEGCVCEEGLYVDENGNCVNESVCDICYVDDIARVPGELYEDPADACFTCECVMGQSVCNRNCDVPTCADNEELSYDVPNACCPICVPKPDTCQKYTKSEILSDEISGCVSVEPVEVDYCAGSCGNSTASSVLMLSLSDSNTVDNCRCCQAITGELQDVAVVCGPEKEQRTAYIARIDQCRCNACVEDEPYFKR